MPEYGRHALDRMSQIDLKCFIHCKFDVGINIYGIHFAITVHSDAKVVPNIDLYERTIDIFEEFFLF